MGTKQSGPGSRAVTQPAVMQAALGGIPEHSLLQLFSALGSVGHMDTLLGKSKVFGCCTACLEWP